MITLVNNSIQPLNVEIKTDNSFNKDDVMFLWEASKSKIALHCDVLYLESNLHYFSGLNRGLDFFNYDVEFKVICLKTYKVLFSYQFKNLKFINGKNVLYISQNNQSGYSYSARNYIYQLLNNGYNVDWKTDFFGNQMYQPCNKEEEFVFKCLNKYDPTKVYDSVIIHSLPDSWEIIIKSLKFYKKLYGLTVWETTHLHQDWIDMINNSSVNEVIVPSYFNETIFKNSNVNKKINVWNHDIFPFNKSIKEDVYNKFFIYKNNSFIKNNILIKNIIKNKTVYYNISQYNERKNINQVIRTFCKKFNGDDNVCLFIKTYFKEFTPSQTEMLKYKFNEILIKFKNPPNIIFCFDELNIDEINFIHEFGDVYFTLNRGEGFGLCTYTAKKIGNNIICGRFGAEIEFLSETDTLIDYKLDKPFNMEVYHNWYNDDRQLWATYDDDVVLNKLSYFPKTIK